ncbi:SCP-like protein [Ancylostoma caninum]|uniref:SCP-like protein n=1 Tax=Ancylostoma caninum TaxID=29170 RepID=A0A368FU73_ANCCA|nr:SCP-like protein [Ancylostoma caninum]
MTAINIVSLILFALFGTLQAQSPASTSANPTTPASTASPTTSSSTVSAASSSSTAASSSSTAASSSSTAASSSSTAASPGTPTVPSGSTSAPPVVTTTTVSTRKPWPKPNCGNPNINNGLRTTILHHHNELRGSLARGQTQTSNGWGIAPPARLMYRLKYDCNAESYAQQAVNTCRRTELPAHALGGHKQNLFIFNNPGASQQQAVLFAIATWWSQLARFGMRSNMMFYQSEFKRGASNVLNWAKMAWWSTKRVGCAAKNCGSFYAVSCMYTPGGAIVNQYVYQVGAVCSGCPSGQCDGGAICRW